MLQKKIQFIQESIDSDFKLYLNTAWSSENSRHRTDIRAFMGSKFSTLFTREQSIKLLDLNWLPEMAPECGFVSISHCKKIGGFSYSKYKHGFDVEQFSRVSKSVLERTCAPAELEMAPRPELLWGAKEAGFKSLSSSNQAQDLLITDLVCECWTSHFENQIFGYRLKTEKTLEFFINTGYIFLDQEFLYSFYFK